MGSRMDEDRRYYLVVALIAVVGSLGCFVFKEDPDPSPEPADDECNGTDSIPEFVDEDFLATDDCDTVDQMVTVRGGRLSIEAGTTLEFAAGAGLRVEEGGSLYARGDDDDPIVLTGADDEAGAWYGVLIDGSTSRDNVVEQTTIESGGESVWDDDEAMGPANLTVRQGRIELSDFVLRDGAGYGLALVDDSQLEISGDNEMTGHGEEPVRTGPNMVGHLTAQTSYQGNDSDYILVDDGTVSDDAVWPQFDVPLLIAGTVVIDANLRISGGNELVFEDGAGLELGDDGDLEMDADDEDDVTIRGDEDVLDDQVDADL